MSAYLTDCPLCDAAPIVSSPCYLHDYRKDLNKSMPKHILMIANTYFQIIFAFQLKNTMFWNDDVTLLISDHSKDAECIAERTKQTQFFTDVLFIRTTGSKDIRTWKEKLEDFFSISFRETNRYQYYLKDLGDTAFDELIVFNYSIETYGVYAILCQRNPDIRVSRFEEGIISYDAVVMNTVRRKLINGLRRLQKKSAVSDALHNFYCFFPDVYKGELHPCGIELIRRDSKVIPLLKQAFDVVDDNLRYNADYIFFTSVYDFEGGVSIGEYELVCRIAELVGKENMIIKTHPRDRRTIYEENGFRLDKNLGIPWEIVLLCADFSGKVIFTVNSTSVISSSLLSSDAIKGYYLYKLCDLSGNPTAMKTTDTICRLLNNPKLRTKLKNITDVEHMDQIKEGLK
ncbi:MAG: alpha-2,8-polysialyltransferase family protein [Ruminococcus sp.]|nr:alpha-2,8-polysialyltransferase family protein [Ruminococcus sp.]